MYRISALVAGAQPVAVQENNRHTDVDAILGACSNKTKLIFIANPNNPTGTMIDAAEVQRCLLYTSPSPRDGLLSRMPSSA